jgi:cysteine desulfurase family protein (TIGR01976 family)
MALDVMLARAQFPALTSEWIYMDNAGGTQVPLQVADSVREYMLHSNVQLGASYELSRKAGEAVANARRLMADLVGAVPDEIVFGANASQLLRMLALVLSAGWEPGDEVIVSQAEHEANVGCWEYLEQFGIEIKTWEIDPESYEFELDGLTDLLSDRTRLIAVHHSSNILGNIMPLKDVVKLAKGCGAMVCVDGVGYVPHRLVDVKDLEVDFYIFSAYKAFGSHLGVMYGKAEKLKSMPRWNHFFFAEDAVPEKFELGSFCYEAAAGLIGLERYYRALGKRFSGPIREVLTDVYADISTHETRLTRDLLSFLASKPRVSVVGEADPRRLDERLPIVSFLVDETDPEELVQKVDQHRIGIRWGHFYAVRLLNALDLLQYKGVVRVSLAHYNTESEIARLKDVLNPLLS